MWPTAQCLPISSLPNLLFKSPVSRPGTRRQDTSSATQERPRPLPFSPLAPREGRASCPPRSAGAARGYGAHALGQSPHHRPEQRALARAVCPRPTTSARRRAPPASRAYFSGSKKGLVPSVWSPMQRKGKGADGLTATELNATVYRYLQESGFVHTAFNFFYEAGIEGGNIHGMIPQGALIRIVHKGLHCIELEANSEIGSDGEHHFFDTLDLITNDLDELRKKITDSSQWKSVKNDKEQNSVETDKAQCSAEATTTAEAMRKMKDAQNSNPEETATIGGTKPMRHAKAQGKGSKEQNTSSAETAQKTGSAETTTGQLWQLSWIGKKPRLRKPRPS